MRGRSRGEVETRRDETGGLGKWQVTEAEVGVGERQGEERERRGQGNPSIKQDHCCLHNPDLRLRASYAPAITRTKGQDTVMGEV